MAGPLILLVPLAEVLGASLVGLLKWATVAAIINYLTDNGVVRAIYQWIAQAALHHAGLELDENDPLSDASLAGAVSKRTGVTLRSLKDKETIMEDLDTFTCDMIMQRAGYRIASVRNVDTLKADLLRIAAAEMTARLGLPVGVLPEDGTFKPEEVKERLIVWAKAEVLNRVGQEIGVKAEELFGLYDFEGLAAEINERLREVDSDFSVTGRKLAISMANKLASKAVTDYQAVALDGTKRGRRKEQIRAAQRRFREKWGNRRQYMPVTVAGG